MSCITPWYTPKIASLVPGTLVIEPIPANGMDATITNAHAPPIDIGINIVFSMQVKFLEETKDKRWQLNIDISLLASGLYVNTACI